MALPKAALFSESVKLRKIKMSDIIIRLVKFLISTVILFFLILLSFLQLSQSLIL